MVDTPSYVQVAKDNKDSTLLNSNAYSKSYVQPVPIPMVSCHPTFRKSRAKSHEAKWARLKRNERALLNQQAQWK